MQAALTALDPAKLAAALSGGGPLELALPIGNGGPGGRRPSREVDRRRGMVGGADRGTEVVLDVRITPNWRSREPPANWSGTSRSWDRCALRWKTGSSCTLPPTRRRAAGAGRPSRSNRQRDIDERWSAGPLNADVHQATVKVDGQTVVIQLRKVLVPSPGTPGEGQLG